MRNPMAYSLSMPHTASAWADFPADVLRFLRAAVTERPIRRPELTPEQRAHRIAMEHMELQRSSAALRTSGWPR